MLGGHGIGDGMCGTVHGGHGIGDGDSMDGIGDGDRMV